MEKLKPVELFATLHRDLPAEVLNEVFVTGSLAAAYAFNRKLVGNAVNTQDADLQVYPAGNVKAAQKMTEQLLSLGWRPTDKCYGLKELPDDLEKLRAIRLMPPASNQYFLELMNIPEDEQVETKRWVPVRVKGLYYGLQTYKFMGVTRYFLRRGEEGIQYAAPEMMALSNLLSHPRVTDVRIESGTFADRLRCAKDLGRVLALAYLSERTETEQWPGRWLDALKGCFPRTWRTYAADAGSGLRRLLRDDEALEDARHTTEVGLLNQLGQGVSALVATGERFLADVIDPFEKLAAKPAT